MTLGTMILSNTYSMESLPIIWTPSEKRSLRLKFDTTNSSMASCLEEIMIMYSYDALKNKMLTKFSQNYMMDQQEEILLEKLQLIKLWERYYYLQSSRMHMHMLGVVKVCQKCVVSEKKDVVPLQHVTEEPFEQWGLDIIGEINPHSLKQHKYILTYIDYFTWWTEEVPLTKVNEEVVINFLEQHLITRFGVPTTLVFYNATYFSSLKLIEFALDKGIILRYATNYYP
jgi:hypothetical protein